jgi:preprotein translocase subunit SecE
MVERRSPKPCVVGSSPTRPVKLSMIAATQKFIGEVVSELRKVAWSTRQELIDSTWIVLISCLGLGVFIATIDFVLSRIVSLILK